MTIEHEKEPLHKRTEEENENQPDIFFEKIWGESWVYIKTVVDVLREPVLILDKNLCVLAANEPFYRTFQVELKETEDTLVYKLGNGQWDIPDLRRLLEDILPKNTFFKGFRVTHEFPSIGRKIMILNARQIHNSGTYKGSSVPSIILLAMEDVTKLMDTAESFANHADTLEKKFSERADTFEKKLALLEAELGRIKKAKSDIDATHNNI